MDDAPPRPPPRTPDEPDGHGPDMHALRTPLTVVILRAQILRRHLRRGDRLPSLEAELDEIEVTLAQLAMEIDRLDHARNRE